MALGAEARALLRLVIRQGKSLALIGVAAGLVAALGPTRVMKELFSVSPTDPATFAFIALLLSTARLPASRESLHNRPRNLNACAPAEP